MDAGLCFITCLHADVLDFHGQVNASFGLISTRIDVVKIVR